VGKHWALIIVEVEILNELATQSANYISEEPVDEVRLEVGLEDRPLNLLDC